MGQIVPGMIAFRASYSVNSPPIVCPDIDEMIRIIRLRDGYAFFFQALDDFLGIDDVFPVDLVQVGCGEAIEYLIFCYRKRVSMLNFRKVIGMAVLAGVLRSVTSFDPALSRYGCVLVIAGLVYGSTLTLEVWRRYPFYKILIRNEFGLKACLLFQFFKFHIFCLLLGTRKEEKQKSDKKDGINSFFHSIPPFETKRKRLQES